MHDDVALHEFKNRKAFRKWLEKNHSSSEGIWLVLNKGSELFTANDALEEALCFGWIDGLMKSIDEKAYKKYFSKRKDTNNWSEKNVKIFKKLHEKGVLTQAGIEAYKGNNEEKEKDKNAIHKKNIELFREALMNDGELLQLFEQTSPSRQTQLAGFYCDAKTEATREKRKIKIMDALRTGNKGMLY
jgi:uncharacterized protein YdeI (YjbR/CyaY-like superfamily)